MVDYVLAALDQLLAAVGLARTSPRRRLPSLSKEHPVGTKEFPYRLTDKRAARRRAITSGIDEFARALEEGMDAETALRVAVDKKRKRLIVLRTFFKHKPPCKTMHGDVHWLYRRYGLDTSGLQFRCPAAR